MLKWAITPRATADFLDEQVGNGMRDSVELLTLQSILEQHQLPCLVRFVNDDIYDSIDNYCLLLCRTTDPYLIVSNETERFSIPVSFDGMSTHSLFLVVSQRSKECEISKKDEQ